MIRGASIKKYSEGKRGGIEAADPIAILAQLAKIAGFDRDQPAEATTNIGERLAAAFKRFDAAKAADGGRRQQSWSNVIADVRARLGPGRRVRGELRGGSVAPR
jgi:hypothetical protein